jgi:hypothetical protein
MERETQTEKMETDRLLRKSERTLALFEKEREKEKERKR